MAILGPLEELDSVAYLRFASVYHHYESVEDFEAAIEQLKASGAASPALTPQPQPLVDQLF